MIAFDVNKFSTDIEKMCRTKDIEYIDAVIHWCEKNKIDIEYIAGIIKKDPVIKSKIQAEAENMNVLKRSAKLPI
jgi:hypothetical protein